MKLITERDLIRRVADRWAATYPVTRQSMGADKQEILARLRNLDLRSCSAADVNAAIGNDSWTRLTCNECGKNKPWVIRVGEEPDYESATACICGECLALVYRLAPALLSA